MTQEGNRLSITQRDQMEKRLAQPHEHRDAIHPSLDCCLKTRTTGFMRTSTT